MKILSSINGRIILVSAMIFFFASIFLFPIVSGYGTSFATAETITSGSNYEYMYADDNYSYYKVDCPRGLVLSVEISMRSPVDLDIFLYDPSQNLVAWSVSSGISDRVAYHCNESGYYYIILYRYCGSGTAAFILNIGLGVHATLLGPLLIIFGIFCILGILCVVLYLSHKEFKTSIKDEEDNIEKDTLNSISKKIDL